jgi:hypothetical protein
MSHKPLDVSKVTSSIINELYPKDCMPYGMDKVELLYCLDIMSYGRIAYVRRTPEAPASLGMTGCGMFAAPRAWFECCCGGRNHS